MLKIRGLKKRFKNFPALDGLDMDVEEGALYGFIGPNGAGKTTAIRIITGLLEADEGIVEIGGKDAFLYREQVKEDFGYVPDEFGMYDNLKVWEYMEFFASCYGLSGLVGRNRCKELLEQVKLSDKADFFVDSLSRGMKQRLCLARAMIHDPKLLVLDEPTSGMDPRARMEFKELLKELCAEGKTILVSSHILSELSSMCTDIGIIDAGRIVLSGNMEEILKKVNDSKPGAGVKASFRGTQCAYRFRKRERDPGRVPWRESGGSEASAPSGGGRSPGQRVLPGPGRSGEHFHADHEP